MRDKITFSPNQPETIRLDFHPPSEPRPGKFGDEYMYTCDEDARILFAKPELHSLIVQSGARAGDELQITRAVTKQGTQRITEWQVQRLTGQPPAAPTSSSSPAPAPPPIVSQPRSAAPPLTENPHVAEVPAAAPEPTPARPAAAPLESNPLWGPLSTAIDAAAAAELQAHRRGLAIRFSAEDVRCMALSLYIDARKGGR